MLRNSGATFSSFLYRRRRRLLFSSLPNMDTYYHGHGILLTKKPYIVATFLRTLQLTLKSFIFLLLNVELRRRLRRGELRQPLKLEDSAVRQACGVLAGF